MCWSSPACWRCRWACHRCAAQRAAGGRGGAHKRLGVGAKPAYLLAPQARALASSLPAQVHDSGCSAGGVLPEHGQGHELGRAVLHFGWSTRRKRPSRPCPCPQARRSSLDAGLLPLLLGQLPSATPELACAAMDALLAVQLRHPAAFVSFVERGGVAQVSWRPRCCGVLGAGCAGCTWACRRRRGRYVRAASARAVAAAAPGSWPRRLARGAFRRCVPRWLLRTACRGVPVALPFPLAGAALCAPSAALPLPAHPAPKPRLAGLPAASGGGDPGAGALPRRAVFEPPALTGALLARGTGLSRSCGGRL